MREGGGYRLAIDPGQVDATRFERLVAGAATAPPPAALASLDEALGLWRGAPYADVAFADFAQAEIRRLDELGAVARARRLRALVDLGRHEEALPQLAREAAEQPLREELARTWALALYRAGRQVEALEALRALGERLAELGLEPAHETRALEHAILVHDPALAAADGDAPPVRARQPPAPSRLPRPAGRFFGREALLAHAATLLDDRALVTIAGVGGAGKTRLSIELAARAGDRFAAGPWWCELAPLRADGDVAGAVADALGMDALDDEPRLAAMTAGGGLLLLDNCEHVVDGAAAAVERLLACSPALRIVATSRVPLGVAGEHVLRLGGLELPADAADAAASPAVALFADRLERAGGAWDDADAPAVADLCRRLDGLPLALELAAARARSMAPAEIAARLHERLSLLTVTGRRANPRHATLGAAIDWSYELLDQAPRRLFERLSVFARGGTLDDVRATCSGYGVAPDAVGSLLDELVAHSLVTTTTVGGRTRYGLLETLREYGTRRLAARGERGRWRDRHADRYAERARAALATGFRERRLPLVDEFDELRTAIRWCLVADATPDRVFLLAEALWWPAPARHAEEIARLVDEVVGHWPGDHPYPGRALGAGSVAWLVAGRAATAHERAVEAVAVGERVGDASLLGRRTLAQIAFFAAPPGEALATWRDVAARARADGIEALGVEADGFAVQLLAAAGDADAAIAGAAAMRADADRLESPFMVSWSLYVSGVVLLERDPEPARRWLERALALSRETDHHHMVRFSLRALGLAAAAA
ncbi:MAG TPA: BTAD domain-containing putative transcriptional regulator, partial [Capillimicrobium sp.]|nr:BTAD domain-containing putative transcriptional regulator [Capillimicrobium sp.]